MATLSAGSGVKTTSCCGTAPGPRRIDAAVSQRKRFRPAPRAARDGDDERHPRDGDHDDQLDRPARPTSARPRLSAQALAEAGSRTAWRSWPSPARTWTIRSSSRHAGAPRLSYTIENGTAKLWGIYNTVTNTWTLYGARVLFRTRRAGRDHEDHLEDGPGEGIAAGATVPEWSRFIHDDASTCFTIDTVTIPGAVASRGPMCLSQRRQRRRELDRRRDDGRRRDRPSPPRPPDVASAWRTAPTVANVGWSNAPAAFLATTDTSRTTDSLTTNTQSGNLDLTGFFVGANIPTTAVIRGIQVEIVRRADNTQRQRRGHAPAQGRRRRSVPTTQVGRTGGRPTATVTYGSYDRPLGNDLDSGTDQCVELRRPVQGRQRQHGRAPRLDQPDPRDRLVFLRSRRRRSAARRARITEADIGSTCRVNAARREPATRASASRRPRSGARRRRSSSRRSISTGGGTTRSRVRMHPCTGSREHLPERLRQRFRGDLDCARQQSTRVGRDHADELELHVPGEGERRAQGRDLVEQRDPRPHGLRHDLHRRRHPLRRQRPDRPLPGPRDHLRERRHRVRRAGLRGWQRPGQLRSQRRDNGRLESLGRSPHDPRRQHSTSQPCCPLQENAEFDHST